ncbi:MAG: hypothetical protein J6U23_11465 [Clostridiales bacterium]|nr:hypothetical protein [Clostridiales bacterium]
MHHNNNLKIYNKRLLEIISVFWSLPQIFGGVYGKNQVFCRDHGSRYADAGAGVLFVWGEKNPEIKASDPWKADPDGKTLHLATVLAKNGNHIPIGLVF